MQRLRWEVPDGGPWTVGLHGWMAARLDRRGVRLDDGGARPRRPRHALATRIVLEARILRVADVYAALVEPRPYKEPIASSDAIRHMRELAGRLDAEAFGALERLASGGALDIGGVPGAGEATGQNLRG